MVGDAGPPAFDTRGFAVLVIDVDQVDVAGDVEFARTQLAHADDPQFGPRAIGCRGRAELGVELALGLHAGDVQRELGQFGDRAGHQAQGRLLVAIERDQPLHDQLAQDAQGGAGVVALLAQQVVGGHHRFAGGRAWRQQCQLAGVTAAQPLGKSRVGRQRPLFVDPVVQRRQRAVV